MLNRIRPRSLSRDKGIAPEVIVANNSQSEPQNEDLIELAPERPSRPPTGRGTPVSSHWGEDEGHGQAQNTSFAFTQDHPIGSILIKQQMDITRLAEKIKLYEMATNINDLCTSFATGIQLERDNTVQSITQKGEEMENKLLAKELQVHRLESAVEPPTSFSPKPVLINNPSKLHECMKVFTRSHKFSGVPGHLSVIEFLTDLNLAQSQCNLSEQEFLERMQAGCTGKAHELVLLWIKNKKNAAEIYTSLLMHYDKRPNIEEAKKMLLNYKIAKHEDLAVAVGKIMNWVLTAAKIVPIGPSRDVYSDHESYQALLRALPEWSRTNVEILYNNLSAKMQRSITFNELDQALYSLRPNIDRDIKKNGVDRVRPSRIIQNRRFRPVQSRHTYSLEAKPAIDTIGAQRFPVTRGRTANSFTPKPIIKRTATVYVKGVTIPNNGIKRNLARPRSTSLGRSSTSVTRNRSLPRNNMNRPRNISLNRRQNQPTGNGCILCGYKNHRADMCRNMKDDNGQIKHVIPPFGKCTICPPSVQPRLNHPPSLCPFRPRGPWAGRNNN